MKRIYGTISQSLLTVCLLKALRPIQNHPQPCPHLFVSQDNPDDDDITASGDDHQRDIKQRPHHLKTADGELLKMLLSCGKTLLPGVAQRQGSRGLFT